MPEHVEWWSIWDSNTDTPEGVLTSTAVDPFNYRRCYALLVDGRVYVTEDFTDEHPQWKLVSGETP